MIMTVYDEMGKPVVSITSEGAIIIDPSATPDEAAKQFVVQLSRYVSIARVWQPISTAPRDGTLFDIRRHGRRYVDCFITSGNMVAREHDYPSVRQVFLETTDENTQWMPRPVDCTDPYDADEQGRLYIP